eukprot:2554100-Prymnesium_polylepis.1
MAISARRTPRDATRIPPTRLPPQPLLSHHAGDPSLPHPLDDAQRGVVHLHRLLQDTLLPPKVQVDHVRRRARLGPITPRRRVGQTAQRVGGPLR